MPLRHALRRLMRSPGFTAVTALTLAIGIGANVAIFSVVEGILLKPLPYPHPGELIAVSHALPTLDVLDTGIAPFLYFTYIDEGRTLQNLAMWRHDAASVTG